ncbi:hypothetical protein L3X38_005227 [Prunus dulcis]|uniref:RST domain-containing protein n=1 Tax=Prunus dulcis TaxID=3755 RepID=A0AAD5F3U6_PRUDU|nr:hypothetical protein L3X38_005227 [Prunus dulcis]
MLVSFKAPSPNVVSGIQPSIQPRQANTSKPTSPWVTFPALMFTLAKFLPPSKMLLIVKCHKRIQSKEDFASTADTETFRSKSLHPASAKRTV